MDGIKTYDVGVGVSLQDGDFELEVGEDFGCDFLGLAVDGFDCDGLGLFGFSFIGFGAFEYVGEGAGAEGLGYAVPCDFLECAICILHCLGAIIVGVSAGVRRLWCRGCYMLLLLLKWL